jgi:uncharacterized protein YndB with AHSA1/START domain
MDIRHETIVMERRLAAPAERVFAAFADPRQRELWSAPGPDAEVRILQSEMRDGGSERSRCGTRGELQWDVAVTYHRVVPNAAIVFSETVSQDEAVLTCALVTFAFLPQHDGGTLLRLTDQVTSFVGEAGADGHRQGYGQALAHLARAVEAVTQDR